MPSRLGMTVGVVVAAAHDRQAVEHDIVLAILRAVDAEGGEISAASQPIPNEPATVVVDCVTLDGTTPLCRCAYWNGLLVTLGITSMTAAGVRPESVASSVLICSVEALTSTSAEVAPTVSLISTFTVCAGSR